MDRVGHIRVSKNGARRDLYARYPGMNNSRAKINDQNLSIKMERLRNKHRHKNETI